MSYRSLLDRKVKLFRQQATGPDDYGNPHKGVIPLFGGADIPCRRQQSERLENIADRDRQVEKWTYFFGPEVAGALDGRGVIVDAGKTLQVEGPPNHSHGYAGVHHVELTAYLIEG